MLLGADASSGVAILHESHAGGGLAYTGLMDDFAIYDVALSQAEIQAQYNAIEDNQANNCVVKRFS